MFQDNKEEMEFGVKEQSDMSILFKDQELNHYINMIEKGNHFILQMNKKFKQQLRDKLATMDINVLGLQAMFIEIIFLFCFVELINKVFLSTH